MIEPEVAFNDIVDNMDLTVGNIMFDNAFLIVYDAKYLP